MKMKSIFRTFIIITGMLIMAACGGGDDLTEPIWLLNSLGGSSLLPDTEITAEFGEDGRLSGSAGCNQYSMPYETSGNEITIGSPGASTMMACPEAIMEQESAYLAALESAATYQIDGDILTLFDPGGEALLEFSAISQDLAGSSWEVIGYNNGKGGVVSVILETEITANFGEDGTLSGFSSCNDYQGPYEVDGDNISMGPFAVTRMFCADPEGLMDQESQYLAALESAATYSIQGMTMEMRTAEGALAANFRRLVSP